MAPFGLLLIGSPIGLAKSSSNCSDYPSASGSRYVDLELAGLFGEVVVKNERRSG